MNYLQNKKSHSFSAIALLGLTVAQLLFFQIGTVRAAISSCEDTQDPDKSKDYIVTILEEQIGQPIKNDQTTGQDENALNCFRQTTCTPTTDTNNKPTTKCEPKIVTKCPSGEGATSDNTTCQPIQVIYASSGATLLYNYIQRIYIWAASTIGIVAVLFLVWGGIEISTAQGDSGKIEKAKARIMQSLGGLVILFLSALILYTINPNFFTK